MHLLEDADASTFVHEIGHIFRRQLAPNDLRIAEQCSGVKDGVWERDHEERFANAFVKYLHEGVAPTPNLQPIFAKYKQ